MNDIQLLTIDIFNYPLIGSYSEIQSIKILNGESDGNDNYITSLIWLSHHDSMMVILIRYTYDLELHIKQTERRLRKWRYTRHYFAKIRLNVTCDFLNVDPFLQMIDINWILIANIISALHISPRS